MIPWMSRFVISSIGTLKILSNKFLSEKIDIPFIIFVINYFWCDLQINSLYKNIFIFWLNKRMISFVLVRYLQFFSVKRKLENEIYEIC